MSTTSCKDPSVTWYDNQDGLNPCQQYSELRKLCDTSYEVPDMNGKWPPDTCPSQKNECCCNSVAFSLSMLCIQCQMGVGTGVSQEAINAREDGVYQLFLAGCGPGTNHSLPTTVQTAVCQSGLKLMRYQYNPFWDNGQWWLEPARQVALDQISKGTLDPGLCSTSSSTTPLHPKTTTAPSDSNGSTFSTSTDHPGPIQDQIEASDGDSPNAALIGGSVGAAAVIIILLALLWWRKRRNKENETRRNPSMANTPVTHSSNDLFTGSFDNSHTALVTPYQDAAIPMTYQPSSLASAK